MTLRYIFVGFFVVALLMSVGSLCWQGSWATFEAVVQSAFEQSKNGFEIALYLTGVLCLWLGMLEVARQGGVIEWLAGRVAPLLGRLFPSIPKGHPVLGKIFMNISANMLGLDNAATPIGLQTMGELQELNRDKTTISDAMIMFLALNASGLTLIPTSIIAFRMQAGATNPADVFLPILLATTASSMVAVLLVSLRQRIALFTRSFFLLLVGVALLFAMIIYAARVLPAEVFGRVSSGVSAAILLGLMCAFLLIGMYRKVDVYSAFVEGAKEGFGTAIGIVPYLVAMLVGIGVFRASGAMDLLSDALRWGIGSLGIDTAFVDAIPTMLMKPLSGSGARGMMVDAMQTHGADSLVGRMCCAVQGSTDTTLYVVALYLGSVGIRRARYLVGYSLFADLVGMVVAVLMTYLFFA